MAFLFHHLIFVCFWCLNIQGYFCNPCLNIIYGAWCNPTSSIFHTSGSSNDFPLEGILSTSEASWDISFQAKSISCVSVNLKRNMNYILIIVAVSKWLKNSSMMIKKVALILRYVPWTYCKTKNIGWPYFWRSDVDLPVIINSFVQNLI